MMGLLKVKFFDAMVTTSSVIFDDFRAQRTTSFVKWC